MNPYDIPAGEGDMLLIMIGGVLLWLSIIGTVLLRYRLVRSNRAVPRCREKPAFQTAGTGEIRDDDVSERGTVFRREFDGVERRGAWSRHSSRAG
ncbi:hypothetical protein [Sphaerisporangium perillae]|uniref:hypothetical protein n=1 Tax=Sphaerisporangium perillae TaxID=2935860 RepID=UPI00200EC736|nr:hypothetical protein [Sphaerisporangium perillae]